MSKNHVKSRTISFINQYLNSKENIVKDIFLLDNYNDYPKFYQYYTRYPPINFKYEAELIANGLSFDKKTSYIKAFMETVERWYLFNQKDDELIYDSYFNLKKKGNLVQKPNKFCCFSQKQLQQKKMQDFRFDEYSYFYWIKVKKMNSQNDFLLPAQLFFLAFDKKNSEPVIRLSDSTGAACGTSLEQALYNSIKELIERDAYAISYYNKLPLKRINLTKVNKKIRFLLDELEKYYFTPLLFDITTDIKIPTCLCILIDQTKVGSKITVGAKCELLWQDAIEGAILESLQAIISMRDIKNMRDSFTKKEFKNIMTEEKPAAKRLIHWLDKDVLERMKYLSNGIETKVEDGYNLRNISYHKKLSICLQSLRDANITEIYWKKTTPKELDKFNIYGVKTVVPRLQPISLIQRYIYLGGKRLYGIPVKLGYFKKPLKENELNSFPHPLP